MKIYVACHSREEAQTAADQLRYLGHDIVSTWHSKEFLPTEQHTPEERVTIAVEDEFDIRRADALLLISGPDRYPGGKFVETGIALGLGLRVFVLGRRENMLLWLPQITLIQSTSEIPNG